MIRLEAFWVKSIEYRKARKARVINSKARVKPETRALKKAGLLSIPTYARTVFTTLTEINLEGDRKKLDRVKC